MRNAPLLALVGALIVSVGVLAVKAGEVPQGLLFIVVGSLIGLSAIAQIRVKRKLRQFAEQRQRPGALAARPARVPAATPPPPFTIVEHRLAEQAQPSLPPPQGLSTLFLWVFDHAPTMALVQRLRRIGPIYLLRGGGYYVDDVLNAPKMAVGKIERFIDESHEEIDARMATFQDHDRNWLGDYESFSMICTDDVWTFAIDRMLARAEAIVIDLSDFKPGHAGIEYELGVVIDRVPLGRVLFVTGPGTDRRAFETTLDSLWTTMAPASPNRATPDPQVHVAVTAHLDVAPFYAGPNASEAAKEHEEMQEALVAEQELELDLIVGLLAGLTAERR